MKLRIKGNSVRIRLSRPEIEQFGRDGRLEDRTEFGSGVFRYVLQNSTEKKELSADFSGSTMTVYVPSAITREWTDSDKVGFEHNADTVNGNTIFILIEKDFKCIDNTTEDQSDNYENPHSSCD